VPPPVLGQAGRAFAERDAQGFVWSVGSQAELQLVLDNLFPLRAAGIYEAALLEALTGTRMNHAHWPLALLHFMLRCADPTRFRAAGDPLPGQAPFRLYRGVAGDAGRRKIRGLHWTATATTAAWFATRFTCTGHLRDPAVYVVDVPASAVLAYVNDRHEDDYLVALPRHIRPRRLPGLAEPIRPATPTLHAPGP